MDPVWYFDIKVVVRKCRFTSQ